MWRNKTVLVLFAIFLAHFAVGQVRAPTFFFKKMSFDERKNKPFQDYYYDDSSFDVCSSSFLCTEDFCSSVGNSNIMLRTTCQIFFWETL